MAPLYSGENAESNDVKILPKFLTPVDGDISRAALILE